MFVMNEEKLKNYAKLIVNSGGNVQKGQLVIVGCDVENARFGRMVAESAYDAGASEVVMEWGCEFSARSRYLRGADEIFDTFAKWRVDKFKDQNDRGAVYLHIISANPNLLAGVDPDRIRRFSIASRTALKDHMEIMMSNGLRWCGSAAPSPEWAKLVFPDLSEDEAMEKLWDYILKGARADGADPIADWKEHKAGFAGRLDYLNKKQFKSLRITTGIGTDLTVGLATNHVWVGGGGTAKDGLDFFPNMPTEEVFTMPDKHRANGRVVASMPLSYQGSLIEGIDITFKDGRAVEHSATKGAEALGNIMNMDEGAKRLGEVALVSSSSPIAKMKTLFYNTLFDENASSHLALGKAYPKNAKDTDKMSAEEKEKIGMNDSLIHVDFMFGTEDMTVTGISENGEEIVFFENGEFVY
ncbi:MAG: aminopeptidase [Defluviitaleaceae bacterium]|nr:aminopeptidase [Defluviitaleaceae bacterium]